MPNERVIEIPWALMHLPQSGYILDVGSWSATYLHTIPQPDRVLHCLDPQDASGMIPHEATFFHESIIGNSLPRHFYDCVLILSTIEHIGLPHYGQQPFADGDKLTLAEAWHLLKADGLLIVTVPVGKSKTASWYRQYAPRDLADLFVNWRTEITYWGYSGEKYVEVREEDVEQYDYRELDGVRFANGSANDFGAGAVAGILAWKLNPLT
jgi:hypothetical protein